MINITYKSRRNNTMEVMLRARLSSLNGITGLNTFKNCYREEVKKIPRMSCYIASDTYRLVEKDNRIEIWWFNSFSDPIRLVAVVTDDGKPTDNPLMHL